jgi:hypothetical protein
VGEVRAPGGPGEAVTLSDLDDDPHPVLARLRAAAPVCWVPALGAWLVTGYELMFGGIETTEGMIANAVLHLLAHPSELGLVLAGRSLVPAAIEESLRLEPAAAVVDRYATSDAQLGRPPGPAGGPDRHRGRAGRATRVAPGPQVPKRAARPGVPQAACSAGALEPTRGRIKVAWLRAAIRGGVMSEQDSSQSEQDLDEAAEFAGEFDERFRRRRREHGGEIDRLDDDQLARLTEEERVAAGVDDYDPDEVPPATDTPPLVDPSQSPERQGARAEFIREYEKGELRPIDEDHPFPPTRYE